MRLTPLLRGFARAAAAISPLLLLGCTALQAYDGPALPRAEVAILRADPVLSAGLPVEVVLRKVDETPIPPARNVVAVLPGAHTLIVDCRLPAQGSTTRFVLEVEVEAGTSYRMEADATARECRDVSLR
ncbi:MAG: hypothetical protein ACO213_08620 [Steroidobacteraceae bacterium]